MRKLVLAGAALLLAQAASADMVTVNGNFVASNWSVLFGEPTPPINPLYLNYSVTFEQYAFYAQDSAVLTILSTNIPYPIKFSYSSGDSAFVLATEGQSGGCNNSPNSFCAFVVAFDNGALSGNGTPFFTSQAGETGAWMANRITNLNAVPEPASWAMLIAGFGLTGAVARRRRSAIAA